MDQWRWQMRRKKRGGYCIFHYQGNAYECGCQQREPLRKKLKRRVARRALARQLAREEA